MGNKTVQTAVILAAGMGTRLRPLTNDRPKCLVEVEHKPMLLRMLEEVAQAGFERVLIVTGYKADVLQAWAESIVLPIQIEWVHNELYDTTNNIYSVYKLKEVVQEGFVLIEADLLLEPGALEHFRQPDRLALAAFNPAIHSGTTADVDESGRVKSLFLKRVTSTVGAYKTVNITSFSPTSWALFRSYISMLIERGEHQIFYEEAIQSLIDIGSLQFDCVDFSCVWWDEIDSVDDLDRVSMDLRKLSEIEV